MTACLSDLRLDELIAGELAADAAVAAADHMAGCPQCRAREEALAADRGRFRAALPAVAQRRRAPWRAAAVGIAAAAAVVIVVAALPRGEPVDTTRSKGGAHLGFVVVHGGAMRVGATGEAVRPGDTLQYLVTTEDAAYVTVLGRDAAGRLTTYVPTDRVAAGHNVQLPVATRLDGSLGREEVVAVFCPEDTPIGSLRALPEGCTIDRLAIEKLP
jgi:anti-sigma factor RsiW